MDRKDHRENCAIVEELAARATPICPPNQHAWRGVQVDVLMPADRQRLVQLIKETVKSADAFLRTAAALSAVLGQAICETSREVEQLIQLGEHFVCVPTVDRDAMVVRFGRQISRISRTPCLPANVTSKSSTSCRGN